MNPGDDSPGTATGQTLWYIIVCLDCCGWFAHNNLMQSLPIQFAAYRVCTLHAAHCMFHLSSKLLKSSSALLPSHSELNTALMFEAFIHETSIQYAVLNHFCRRQPIIPRFFEALGPLKLVEDDGIEPTTPCLQSRCSPS
jgi:hypothetical protein